MKTDVMKKLIIITFMLTIMTSVFGQSFQRFVPPTGNSYVVAFKKAWNNNENVSFYSSYSDSKSMVIGLAELFSYEWFYDLTVEKVDIYGYIHFKAVYTSDDGSKCISRFYWSDNPSVFHSKGIEYRIKNKK